MIALLTILACFAGVFAFAFGTAGSLGLLSFEPPSKKGGLLLCFLDHTLADGAFTALGDITRNWKSRPTERRFMYAGLACAVVCIALVIIIRKMS